MDIFVQEINLKSTEIVGSWGSTPDPTGGAYDAPPNPIIGFARDSPIPPNRICKSLVQINPCPFQNIPTSENFLKNALPHAATFCVSKLWDNNESTVYWAMLSA